MNKRHLTASVVLASALALTACGGGTDTAAGNAGSTSSPSAETAKGNDADLAFLTGMKPHHEQAVKMSEIILAANPPAGVAAIAKQFASDLDAASRQQLTRGARLMELLKQPQYSPYPIEDQVVSIWAGTKGKLDKIAIGDVLRFERELLDHLRQSTKVLDHIAGTGKLSEEDEAELHSAVDSFVTTFLESENAALTTDTVIEGGSEAEVEQEQIVAQRSSKSAKK